MRSETVQVPIGRDTEVYWSAVHKFMYDKSQDPVNVDGFSYPVIIVKVFAEYHLFPKDTNVLLVRITGAEITAPEPRLPIRRISDYTEDDFDIWFDHLDFINWPNLIKMVVATYPARIRMESRRAILRLDTSIIKLTTGSPQGLVEALDSLG